MASAGGVKSFEKLKGVFWTSWNLKFYEHTFYTFCIEDICVATNAVEKDFLESHAISVH